MVASTGECAMKMKSRFASMLIFMPVIFFTPLTGAVGQSIWTEDFDAAKATAKAENKFMLLDFTGSDWCGWCIKLDKEVFSKNEFKKYARGKLVCVVLDYPVKKKPPKQIQQQNEELKRHFGIRGYPTIIMLDPNGEKIGQTGYKEGGPDAYIQHLEAMIAPHAAKFGEPKAGSGPEVSRGSPTAPGNPGVARTWTSSSGSTLEAQYVRRVGNIIELRRDNGTMVRIDLSSLAEADHEFLRSIRAIQ
jgi:thioredoxin-related protein